VGTVSNLQYCNTSFSEFFTLGVLVNVFGSKQTPNSFVVLGEGWGPGRVPISGQRVGPGLIFRLCVHVFLFVVMYSIVHAFYRLRI